MPTWLWALSMPILICLLSRSLNCRTHGHQKNTANERKMWRKEWKTKEEEKKNRKPAISLHYTDCIVCVCVECVVRCILIFIYWTNSEIKINIFLSLSCEYVCCVCAAPLTSLAFELQTSNIRSSVMSVSIILFRSFFHLIFLLCACLPTYDESRLKK